MLRALRARPWLLAAAAAALVGVPVAGVTVLAGGGDAGGGERSIVAGNRAASGSDIDRLIAQRRAGGQAVEPSVGAPSQVIVQNESATDFPAPSKKGKDGPGSRVSPGAPSDAEIRAQLRSLAREQKRVEQLLLASGAPIRKGSGAFIWPVNGPITSPFCERRSWEACHPGIDIGVGTGTPIRAASTGQVVLAGPQGGYGNFTCVGAQPLAEHLLRPPVADPGRRRPGRPPGRGDRPRRVHRPVLRLAPALRGAGQRARREPPRLPLIGLFARARA